MKTSKPPLRRRVAASRAGFTLIELLTVIAIIGILAGILIPVVGRVRESAYRTKCASNARSLAQACHIYSADHGDFPPTEGMFPDARGNPQQGNWLLRLDEMGYLDMSGPGVEKEDITYCPSAIRARNLPRTNQNTYGINFQASGGWLLGGTGTIGNARNTEVAQEPTQTAMIMDGSWDGSSYRTFVKSPGSLQPIDYVHPPARVDSDDLSSGVNVAFVDTHVRFMTRAEIDEKAIDDIFWRGVYP